MIRILPDGSVPTHGLNKLAVKKSDDITGNRFSIYRCKIVEVLYPTNPKNSTYNDTYKQIEYNCIVLDGSAQGTLIYNVVDCTGLGGKDNYSEIVRTAESDFQPSNIAKRDWRNTDGDIVLVAFLDGQLASPIMIGGYKHPQSPNPGGPNKNATFNFNGINIEVNPNGGLKIKQQAQSFMANINEAVNDVIDSAENVIDGAEDFVENTLGDTIKEAYLAGKPLPDDVVQTINSALSSVKESATEMLGDVSDLAGLGGLPDSITTDLSALTPSQISQIIGVFAPKETSINISANGVLDLRRGAQKVMMDPFGQIIMKGPGGAVSGMLQGGVSVATNTVSKTFSKTVNLIESTLTKIGKVGFPAAKIGDVSVGHASDGSVVVSKLVSGSFINMIGA